uniref:MADS-box domain-containing protein n=1 Tax=Kalanchoe fedtschenkoi TaxID=63787 RepID=A0A7N0TIM5_KALFE
MMRSDEQVTRKRTRGRRKIPIEKIKCPSARQVTFSKRREGLFRKASELAVLCGAEFAIIAISGGSKVYSFGNPDAGTVINHYLNKRKMMRDYHSIVDEEAIGSYVRAVEALEGEKRKLAAERGGGGKGFEEWKEEKIQEMSLEEMEEYLKWLECLRTEIVEKIGEPSA